MKVLRYLATILIGTAFGGVFVWVFGSAFKSRSEIFDTISPLSWRTLIPLQPTLNNLRELLLERDFANAMLNSAILAVAAIVVTLILSSMIAFVLAYLRMPGRGAIFALILGTMLIPFEARLVPTFLTVNSLGMQDTFLGLLLPLSVDAFTIFLLRQHFAGVPNELFEAGLIDGCSYFRVYWNIMMPNIVPALVSAGFTKFMFAWDAFVWPLIIVRDPAKEVIGIAMARLFTEQDVLWQLVFAGSLLATIPAIVIFLVVQRYYIESAMTSGLGGQ